LAALDKKIIEWQPWSLEPLREVKQNIGPAILVVTWYVLDLPGALQPSSQTAFIRYILEQSS
jgi:hypothetical protein